MGTPDSKRCIKRCITAARLALSIVCCAAIGCAAIGCTTAKPRVEGGLAPQTLTNLPPPEPVAATQPPPGAADSTSSGAPSADVKAAAESAVEGPAVEQVSALDLAEPKPAEAPAKADPTLVVISSREDEAEEEEDVRTLLLRASREETARRQFAAESVLVLTDKNLAEMAEGGHVTVVPEPPPEEGEVEPGALADPSKKAQEQELYWRDEARDRRLRWREAADEIVDLEQRVAELRQQFYAEDDPYVRDGKIKPEWDRALDRLEQARREEVQAQRDVEDLLDEGRRAGALPGWLREGMVLEPVPEEKEELPAADPMEPKVVNQP